MNDQAEPRWGHRAMWGLAVAALVLAGGMLVGCGGSSSGPEFEAPLFPEDGNFEATIRRTTNGVPHVRADDLGSAAFGAGYAQTQDNVCYLAEAIVKARSERAKYFGPHRNPAVEDNLNVINDFTFKAQRIRSGAEEEFEAMSPEGQALIEGFTAGYNQYVNETDPSNLPLECRDQPWVKEIEPTDLLAHYRMVAQFASGGLFADGPLFIAVPGEDPADAEPEQTASVDPIEAENLTADIATSAKTHAAARTNFSNTGLASNAWGIGSEMSSAGRGALLANPHFPYTGPRRLYQMQMTVPDYLNVNGAGLLGTAVPLINFNENLAWSHTVSTSRRFTLYQLTLKDGDDFTYIKDDQERSITSETFTIEVNTGAPEPIELERTFYFSDYGPMISANAITQGGLPKWGDEGTAFTYRDANADTNDLLDTWLQMSRASNLEEFRDVFRDCGSTLWTNTTYADDQGNAYYIDSSSVPNLSDLSLSVIAFKRSQSDAFNQLFENGLTLLDGDRERDDWIEGECGGLVPFEKTPQLVRSDWVQNANDSHWATNPEEFLTGFSALFGPEKVAQGPRTRLSLKMLQNPLEAPFDGGVDKQPAGQDGTFSAQNLIDVIWNNRAWYTEQFLPELRERCNQIGSTEVEEQNLEDACGVLADWDGFYDLDSVGAHVFRVFIANYLDELPGDLTKPFDPEDPVATPSTPSEENKGTADDTMLVALAKGVKSLDEAGIDANVQLGDVQVYQPSGGVPPLGTPQELGQSFPWHGGDGTIDGAFNAIGVITSPFAEDTLFPRIAPETLGNTAGLSQDSGEGWLMARGTSFHFGLEFTEEGPVAYGLTSYGQSTDSGSPFFNDQSQRYSDKDARRFPFTETEIEQNLIPNGVKTISQ